MDIAAIDPRLGACEVKEKDVVWYKADTEGFSLHGIFFDKENGHYRRMPKAVAEKVSEGVTGLSRCTSGGRLRFRTDSPYVAIRAIIPANNPMAHMPLSGSHGFSVYAAGRCVGKVTPTVKDVTTPGDNRPTFAGSCSCYTPAGMHDVEIYFPLYCGVFRVEIGLKEGAVIEPATPYAIEKPIVVYGSSIIQGACATRPGNDVVSYLSRMFNADIINLGFSGCGNSEAAMIDYLCSLEASAIIFDHNYYVDRTDRVIPEHYSVYRRLRDAHPDIPIIMVDKPGCDYDQRGYKARREMMMTTYEKAVAEGDKKAAVIDAYDFFGDDYRDSCLVDLCHPTDLGFLRMAQVIEKVLKPLL